MHSRKMETSALIRAVKQREILWNSSHDRYFHKTKKKLAWIEVCGELFENFDEQDDVRQKILIQDVMSRWRTIRDNFVRKRKQNSKNPDSSERRRSKKYIFDDELDFLRRILDRRSSTSSNPNHLEQKSQVESFYEGTEEGQSFTISFNQLSPKRELESPVSDEKPPTEVAEEQTFSQLDPFDEDLGFFISLLPTVKSLSRLEKLDFRIKTMQLLREQVGERQERALQGISSGRFQGVEFSTCGSADTEQMFYSESS